MNRDLHSDIENYIGWLAPDGTHFSCDRYGHDALARSIIKEYYEFKANKTRGLVCDDMLIAMGWCRIGFSTFLSCGYSIQANWKKLSDVQKSFIRDMYFEFKDEMTEDTINHLKDYDIIDLFLEPKQVDIKIKKLKK